MAVDPGRLELSVTMPSWAETPGEPATWLQIRELARRAEAGGIDAVFVADQSGFTLPDGTRTEFWDGLTLLPALAAVTSTVAVGTLVATPLLRHPITLARMACALDEVSGGRVILGLGAADAGDRAVSMLGIPPDRLFSRFAEAVEIIVRLLHEGTVDFDGSHFAAHQAWCGPAGPRDGSIPVWIAAGGPRMLRLAARWADAVNFRAPLTTPENARAAVEGFEAVCRELGCDPASVQKSGWAMVSFARESVWPFALSGRPERIAAQLHALHRAGISHVSCYVDDGVAAASRRTFPLLTGRGLAQLEEVIGALRELEAADSIAPH